MQAQSTRVKFLPVKVKLHWPDRWCSYCLQETWTMPEPEMYYCPSCDVYSRGRTEFVEATVRPL